MKKPSIRRIGTHDLCVTRRALYRCATTCHLIFFFFRQNDNRLTTIGDATFASLKNLRILRLDNNRITSFPVWNVLRSLPALKRITLSGNPWSCACDFVQKLQVKKNFCNAH